MKALLPCLLATGALVLASAASAQAPLAKDSPFQTGGVTATKTAPADPYQLTGVTVMPEATRVCIYEAKAQQSHWIAVGAAAGGIQVVSYDAAQKQAVISVDGTHQTLALHESPASAEAPPPATPEAKAKEARLLTGDLLEVGMQQREAYAKAHSTAGN